EILRVWLCTFSQAFARSHGGMGYGVDLSFLVKTFVQRDSAAAAKLECPDLGAAQDLFLIER
ncbi:hypothetical protein RSW84_27215, partial [Escherichia coli]|uniref:hypothetical protein n=1 Tax=Escherichia coli TaxID=562 RepID=UPI0028DF70A4